MPKINTEVKLNRGIYLLPNLFTMTGLFAGFYAIVAATIGHYDNAAIAIFVAMIMDSLDGRIARWTNTQTAFGTQFDSLSDMVSFGIAPALVVYTWALIHVGKIGWLAAFIYTVGGALRLARFNVQTTKKVDKRYFRGLAIPAAAAIAASFTWVVEDYSLQGATINLVAAILMAVLGLLMVSNIPYRSFKDLELKGKVPFIVILLVVLMYVLISIDPPEILFILFSIYGLSGPWSLAIKWWQHRRSKKT